MSRQTNHVPTPFIIETLQNVRLPVSEAFGLVHTGSKLDITQLSQKKLAAFSYKSNMNRNIGVFMGRLLSIPYYEVGSNVEFIRNAFLGAPAPDEIDIKYRQNGHTSMGKTLNAAGAAEVAKYHVTALRRIRGQILPVGTKAGARPLGKVDLGECPFGSDCLFQLYGAVVAELRSVMGKVGMSFVLREDSYDKRSMVPVKITDGGCTCPFQHNDDSLESMTIVATRIVAIAQEEYWRILWCRINGFALDSSSSTASRITYSMQDLISNDRDTNAARANTVMTMSLDNVSSDQLLKNHTHNTPSKQDVSIQQLTEDAYAIWKRAPDFNEIPYGAYHDPIAMANITEPVEVTSKAVKPSVKATPIVAMADDDDDVIVQAPAAAVPVLTPSNMLIPRMVTDEFLATKGFNMDHYQEIDCRDLVARDQYLEDKLSLLFSTHIPKMSVAQARERARMVARHHLHDANSLFVSGYAYVALMDIYITENLMI